MNAAPSAETTAPPHLPCPLAQIESEEPGEGADEAFVSFTVQSRPNAPGSQGKPPEVQKERSRFVREGGAWLYRDFL